MPGGPSSGSEPGSYDQAAYTGWQDYLAAQDARDRLESLKEAREEQAAEEEAARQAAAQAAADADAAARARDDLFTQLADAEARYAAANADVMRLDAVLAANDRDLAFARAAQHPSLLSAAADGLQHLLEAFRASGLNVRALAGRSAALSTTRQQIGVARARAQLSVTGTVDRLDASGSGLAVAAQRRDEASRRAAAADAEIARIDDQVARAKDSVWAQALAAESPDGQTLSPGHSTVYRFIWPEPGAWISQGWGPSTLLGEPAFLGYAHFHTGVDLAAPANTIVYAADDGVVAVASTGGYSGYGSFIILNHQGGVSTLYGHLNKILVAPGQAVHQGQPIGLEGSTGYSTGPHLHFETRINGTWVNPLPFLPPGPPSNYRR